MCPARPWTASLTASLSVGCEWMLRATSTSRSSHCWARVNSGSNSVTSGPMHVAAEEFPGRGVTQELHEADGVGDALRLAIRRKRKLRDLDCVSLFDRLRLGPAEACDLRLAERRAGAPSRSRSPLFSTPAIVSAATMPIASAAVASISFAVKRRRWAVDWLARSCGHGDRPRFPGGPPRSTPVFSIPYPVTFGANPIACSTFSA